MHDNSHVIVAYLLLAIVAGLAIALLTWRLT